MTADEAHDTALRAAAELAKWGIETTISPSPLKHNEGVKSRFCSPQSASPDSWVHVRFAPASNKEIKMIDKARKALFKQGVEFGYGSSISGKEFEFEYWDLDHSFKYEGL